MYRCPFYSNLIRLVFRIVFCYELLKLFHVFLGDCRLVAVIVVIEEHGEHVGHGLALGVSHSVDGGVGTFGQQLVLQAVAAAVAADDASHFPEAEVVKELTAGDAYLAHE